MAPFEELALNEGQGKIIILQREINIYFYI